MNRRCEIITRKNAELLQRTLGDFHSAFAALTPPEQSEALQCVLKGVSFIQGGKIARNGSPARFELATLRLTGSISKL
jgi:hypothetical protein